MGWRDDLLQQLESGTPGGYTNGGEHASEPTALAGIALFDGGRPQAAQRAADWLAGKQGTDGTVGIFASQATPCWPTSLAIMLWQQSDPARYRDAIARAVAWTLEEKGKAYTGQSYVAHDTSLVGWSWAANTHSWLEPTALFVLALKAVGHSQHPRTREAVRLLVDRLLPHGGCNYGNTFVLGQELMQHVEPTGVVMMALADEQLTDPRIEGSLDYLEGAISADSTTASLCYGLLGLTAHGRAPTDSDVWLQAAYERTTRQSPNTYKLALIALASSPTFPFHQ